MYAYVSIRNISIRRKETVYPYINAHINKTKIPDLQLSLRFTFAALSFEIFVDLKPKQLVETFESLYDGRDAFTVLPTGF